MKVLYSNGDSWSFGTDLNPESRENDRWSAILSDKMNVLGMDEVVFESASKVGTLSVYKIHDENGRIIPDIFDQ